MPQLVFPFFDKIHEAASKAVSMSTSVDVVAGSKVSEHNSFCEDNLASGDGEFCVLTVGAMTAVPKLGAWTFGSSYTRSGCIVFQPNTRTLSFSFNKPLAVNIGLGSFSLSSVMASQRGCSTVTLMERLDPATLRMIPKEEIKSHAGIKMGASLTILLSLLLQVEIDVTADAYVNLDYSDDGTLVSPSDVLKSALDRSCITTSTYKSRDWAFVLQKEMKLSIIIGGKLKMSFLKIDSQYMISHKPPQGPRLELSFELSNIEKIEDIFETWSEIPSVVRGWICDSTFTPKNKNPFCKDFDGFGKISAKFYVSAHSSGYGASSSTDVAVKANIGGTEMSVHKNAEKAWTACYGSKCTNFCVWEADCPTLADGDKRICAQFSGRFQCEYKYQACCTATMCNRLTWDPPHCSRRRSYHYIDTLKSVNSVKCKQHTNNDGTSGWLGLGMDPWNCRRMKDEKPTVTKSGWCRKAGSPGKFPVKATSVPSSGSGSSSAGSGSGSSSGTAGSGSGSGSSSSSSAGSGSSSGTPSSGSSSAGSGSGSGSSSGSSIEGENQQDSASDAQCPGGEDTGGRCSYTSCKTSRGGVTCQDGKCVCKPGYCLTGGEKCEQPVGANMEVSKSYRGVMTPPFFVLVLSKMLVL